MTMADNLLSDPAAPSFDDPLGMLSACHRRIERQLAARSFDTATIAAIGRQMAQRRGVASA